LLSNKNISAVRRSFIYTNSPFPPKEKIKSASISSKKRTVGGAITNSARNYTITVINSQRTILQSPFAGDNNTNEETVNERASISIKLEPSVVNLNEVVSISYNTQTRSEITGSGSAPFRNGAPTSGNGASTSGNGASTSGNGASTSGNGALTSGNGALTSGNGALTSGNGALTSGNGALTSGNGASTSGNGALTSGNGASTSGNGA
jgi:hypothetical protein